MFTGCFSICGHPSHSPRLSAIFLGISNILSSQGCVIDIFSWRSICRPFVIRYCIHFVLVFWVLSLIVFCYVHFLISLLSVTFVILLSRLMSHAYIFSFIYHCWWSRIMHHIWAHEFSHSSWFASCILQILSSLQTFLLYYC